jgi:hypothetical protein
MAAMALALHKSRFIIPQIITLVKRRKDLSGPEYKEVTNRFKENFDQLPGWIWLFWLP